MKTKRIAREMLLWRKTAMTNRNMKTHRLQGVWCCKRFGYRAGIAIQLRRLLRLLYVRILKYHCVHSKDF
jgi:hypothetical protein